MPETEKKHLKKMQPQWTSEREKVDIPSQLRVRHLLLLLRVDN